MQYFHCCPATLSNYAAEETVIATQQQCSSPGDYHNTNAHNLNLNLNLNPNASTSTSISISRTMSTPTSRTTPWNAVSCNTPVNPYHVLELRRDATPSEIIESYRKLALIYHPGRKIACPLERRKRLQFFEVLAACYESLMHGEFRRRCDALLKEMEKKQARGGKANTTMTANHNYGYGYNTGRNRNINSNSNSSRNRNSSRNSSHNNKINTTPRSKKTISIVTPEIETRQSLQERLYNDLVVNEADSIPGLLMNSSSESTSESGEGRNNHNTNSNNNNNNNNHNNHHSAGSSADSVNTVQRNNCTLGVGVNIGMFVCASREPQPRHQPNTNTNTNHSKYKTTHNASSPHSRSARTRTTTSVVNFAISRDGTNGGFRSLVDSSSLSASQASAEEEAEIHFSEAAVYRLFGGPLASLHRARNFQAFSDPYVVFDKVFGNRKPIFPRVTIADIDADLAAGDSQSQRSSMGRVDGVVGNNGNGNSNSNGNNNAQDSYGTGIGRNNSSALDTTRTHGYSNSNNHPGSQGFLSSSTGSNNKIRNRRKHKKGATPGDDNTNNNIHNEAGDGGPTTGNTKLFVSSRVVNGRKITKTETVHVDPDTGIASVNVTVDGEFLEPTTEVKSSQLSSRGGGGVADWLLCFGMARSKVTPAAHAAAAAAAATTTTTTGPKSPSLKSSPSSSGGCCPKNKCTDADACPSKDDFSSSCHDFRSLYVEVLHDFYVCNQNFYEECNRYMHCGVGSRSRSRTTAGDVPIHLDNSSSTWI